MDFTLVIQVTNIFLSESVLHLELWICGHVQIILAIVIIGIFL